MRWTAAFHQRLSRVEAICGACMVWAAILAFVASAPVATASEGFSQETVGNQTVYTQTRMKVFNEVDAYNIGTDEVHIYNQPGSSAVFLQQVIGGDPSEILGRLSANGQVWVLNPCGVLIGRDAVINTAGFTAAAMAMASGDFFSGNYTLNSNGGAGDVVNNGTIVAEDGGYAILAGGAVRNNGLIAASRGEIILASGGFMTFDFSGDGLISFGVDEQTATKIVGPDGMEMNTAVDNAGELSAAKVLMTASAARDVFESVVNNDGIIEANSVSGGAVIRLLGGEEGGVVASGDLTAGGENSAIEITSADGVAINGSLVIDDDGVVTIVADSDGDAAGNVYAGADEPALIQSESGSITIEGYDVIMDDVDVVTTGGGDVKITSSGGYAESAATTYRVTGSLSIDPPDPAEVNTIDTFAKADVDYISDNNVNVNQGALVWADDIGIISDADESGPGVYPNEGDIVIGAEDPLRQNSPLPAADALGEIRAEEFVELDANDGNIYATEHGRVTSHGNAEFSANQVIGAVPGTEVDVRHLDQNAPQVAGTNRSRMENGVSVGAITVDINGNLTLNALGMVQGISGNLQGNAGSLTINPNTPGMIIWNGLYIDHMGPLAVAYAQALSSLSPYEVNELGGVEDLRLGSEYYGGGTPYDGTVMDNRARFDVLNSAVFVPYEDLITDQRLMKPCVDE